jgi:hypothetical protein
MAQSSTFTQLVNVALATLDDPSTFKTPQTFYKNGERGHIHANRFCHKLNDSHRTVRVEFSLEAAATKRQCKECFDRGVLDPQHELLLRRFLAAETSIVTAERCLESKRGITDPGATIVAIREGRDILSAIKEAERDLAEAAIAKFHARLDEAERRNAVRLTEAAGRLTSWAAGSLLKSMVNDGVMTIPGADPVTIRVFGLSPLTGRGRENQIEDVYTAWCAHRNQGMERALERARETAAQAELHQPWQLGFAVREHIADGNLQEQVEHAWRNEVTLRLQEQLIPAWESRYRELVNLEQPCVVGISGYSLNHDQSRTILSVNPTVEASGNGGVRVVTVVPEILARWLTKYESRWNTTVDVVERGIEPELLDAVLALWQPRDTEAEFHRLGDAIEAAATL